MGDTLASMFSGGGSMLGGAGSFLSSKTGLDILQAGTTGLGIMAKLAQGSDNAANFDARAGQYAMESYGAGITAQGQADTAKIGADAAIQQVLQRAFAEKTGDVLSGQMTQLRTGAAGYAQGQADITAGLTKGTGLDIQAGQTAAQAGAGFAYNAGQDTSLKRSLVQKLGSITAAGGASGLDVGASQAAGSRVTQQVKDVSDAGMAQTMMRYGAGLASADVMRAAATAARGEGQTQATLVNRLADITGERAVAEGGIAGDLAQRTADIAVPVEQLKGDLAQRLALASGRVAQAQDTASEMNALMAGRAAGQQARAGALMSGLGGLFSIFARGI